MVVLFVLSAGVPLGHNLCKFYFLKKKKKRKKKKKKTKHQQSPTRSYILLMDETTYGKGEEEGNE